MTQVQSSLHNLAAQKSQAKALLEELVSAHRTVVAVAGDTKRDLYKRVTGHSSIENAIESTRRAIEAYERMQSRGPLDDNKPLIPVIRVTSTGVPSIL